jgi:hypothetical protein
MLGELVFDADCEDMGKEIDLDWYEQKVSRLSQENDL